MRIPCAHSFWNNEFHTLFFKKISYLCYRIFDWSHWFCQNQKKDTIFFNAINIFFAVSSNVFLSTKCREYDANAPWNLFSKLMDYVETGWIVYRVCFSCFCYASPFVEKCTSFVPFLSARFHNYALKYQFTLPVTSFFVLEIRFKYQNPDMIVLYEKI